jgi:hypothetical protein
MFSFILALILGAGAATKSRAADAKEATLSELSLEVAALQSLHRFQLTIDQMEALRKLAAVTVPNSDKREPGKASDNVRKRLIDLREALLDGDDDRIEDLEEKLANLLDEEEEHDLDDVIKITKPAIKAAPEALKLFRAAQVIGFLANSADDVPDPLDVLHTAVDVAPELTDDEWKDYADDVVEELKWLLGGIEPDGQRAVGEKVGGFLKKVRSLNANDLEKQRRELVKSADAIVAATPATTIIHNFTEHALSELLSNPRLIVAIDAQIEKDKELEKKEKEKEKEKPKEKEKKKKNKK